MGDSPVKDFFDLDMKDKMRIIESRKKLEKDLIRVVYAPVLLTCKAGVEKRYNEELTAICNSSRRRRPGSWKTTGSVHGGAIC